MERDTKQDEKLEGVKVVVRLRPPNDKDLLQKGGLAVTASSEEGQVVIEGKEHTVRCTYDSVFDEHATQADVFDVLKPAIAQVTQGYNACVFAYGQTGSGKTHTMLGPEGGRIALTGSVDEALSVIPRAVAYLHSQLVSLTSKGGTTFSLHCSYMQIYNEKLHDLLQEQGFRDNLEIHEMVKGKNRGEIYVSGLAEFRVRDVDDVLELIQLGNRNRAIRATECNEVSSRSHAILQLLLEVESCGANGQRTMKRAKLSMVDLAGSEKIRKGTDITQKHLRELTSINKSLSSLGNVISALTEKSRTHIPYRDSKLTRLMQDSLGGNCRTVVIACISPGRANAEESISTSQFADRAKNVLVRVKANEVVDDKVLLARAQAEIERLKQRLRVEAGGGEGGGSGGDEEKDREVAQLQAENTALRAEVKRLKFELAGLTRRKIMGQDVHGGRLRTRFADVQSCAQAQRGAMGDGRVTCGLQPAVGAAKRSPVEAESEEGWPHYDDQDQSEEPPCSEENNSPANNYPLMKPPHVCSPRPSHVTPQRRRSAPVEQTVGIPAVGTFNPVSNSANKRRTRPRSLSRLPVSSSWSSEQLTPALRREEERLISIREQRKKLEQQLAALQKRSGGNNNNKATNASPTLSATGPSAWTNSPSHPSPLESSRHKPPLGKRHKRSNSLTSQHQQRPSTSDSSLQRHRSITTSAVPCVNQLASPHVPDSPQGGEDNGRARLRYTIADLGLQLRVYSFRYDEWSSCKVIGYDRIRKLHYCHFPHTGEKQWHSLKGKKVEVLPPTPAASSCSGADSPRTLPSASKHVYGVEDHYDDDAFEAEPLMEGGVATSDGSDGQHIHLKKVVNSPSNSAVVTAAGAV